MSAPRISDRDYQAIRKRYWAEKARQAREDQERDTALRDGTWFRAPVNGDYPLGTY